MDIELKPLSDLCLSITDCPHSTPQWLDEGYLVIRNYNIKDGRLLLSDVSYTNEETFKQRNQRAKPEAGDIIITREAPMGEVCIVPDGLECCMGQRMVLLKPDTTKVNTKYLLYVLMSDYVQRQIRKSEGTGSIVSNLDIPDLKALPIPNLPIPLQERIGALLFDIDAKVDLNNKINTELEGLVKINYDYWFKQFEFPDEEGNPYNSSGGKMVWNEQLQREVPEGWTNGVLSDLVENISDTARSGEQLKGLVYTPIEQLPKKKMTFGGGLDYSEANSSLILYKKFDILIGAMRVYFHRVCIAPFDGVTRTTTIVIRAKNLEHLPYIYQTIFDDATIQFASTHSVGTQQPYVKWDGTLENYNILIPKSNIIDKFCCKVDSILEIIREKEIENNDLKNLRSWLLPMLMNSQVAFR